MGKVRQTKMKQALVIVDYQKDFVSGSLGFDGAELLDEKIAARIEEALRSGTDVIYTLDTHDAGYPRTQEGRKLPVPHCIEGTGGHEIYGRTASYLPQAVACIRKPVFGSWELGEFVRARRYGVIELCGLVSHICVLSNAVVCRSALPEAEIRVRADCTGSGSPALHEAALAVMRSLQVDVI